MPEVELIAYYCVLLVPARVSLGMFCYEYVLHLHPLAPRWWRRVKWRLTFMKKSSV